MTKISLGVGVLCASLLLINQVGLAANEPVCAGLPLLASKVKDCQQNVFFVQAADGCLIKLEHDIEAQQALLSAAALLNSANAGSSQSARMANTVQDLSQMQGTLESLEKEALRVKAEIQLYSQNFTYAGPLSKGFAEHFHMTKFLEKFPCFANNQSMLTDDVQRITKHVDELEKARQAAGAMAKTTTTYQKSLDATSIGAAATGRSTASTPTPAQSKPAQNGASTITGNINEKKLP